MDIDIDIPAQYTKTHWQALELTRVSSTEQMKNLSEYAKIGSQVVFGLV